MGWYECQGGKYECSESSFLWVGMNVRGYVHGMGVGELLDFGVDCYIMGF